MNHCLEAGESISFRLSQFNCVATYFDDPPFIDAQIQVVVRLCGGNRYMIQMGPNLTVDQIKELTAYKLLELLTEWATDLQKAAMELRS